MENYRIKELRTVWNAHIQDPVHPRTKVNGANPYDEQIMSMPTVIEDQKKPTAALAVSTKATHPGYYFFFIYNLQNYYHFVYDTLPYLWFYFHIKRTREFLPLKLLLPKDHKFLQFQREFLALLGFKPGDFVYAEDNARYECLYIPTSLTYGRLKSNPSQTASNAPPDHEAHAIWNMLVAAAPQRSLIPTMPRKFYISRRPHGNLANIGTNYTTRRRCINEDELVGIAASHGFKEIFCENLTTEEKLALFAHATHIVGFVGGGLTNALFSPPSTVVCCIETPDFLLINSRFMHSVSHTRVTFLPATSLAPYKGIPLYTRVKSQSTGHIGEVVDVLDDGRIKVQYSEKPVAGFALDGTYVEASFPESDLVRLDNGLNSPFVCDLDSLRKYFESVSES